MRGWDWHELRCVLVFLFKAVLEAVWGLLTWIFQRQRLAETPDLHFIDTSVNRAIIDSVPALQSFKNCPWASGAHAQTFFSLIKFGKRPTPRRDVVVMADGVQVVLDWFDAPDTPLDAPLVVTLHGIGGDQNSVRPLMVAEECLKRGWRSVLYVRRGHGISSLLPQVVEDDASELAGATLENACAAGSGDPSRKADGLPPKAAAAGVAVIASAAPRPGPAAAEAARCSADRTPATAAATMPPPSPARPSPPPLLPAARPRPGAAAEAATAAGGTPSVASPSHTRPLSSRSSRSSSGSAAATHPAPLASGAVAAAVLSQDAPSAVEATTASHSPPELNTTPCTPSHVHHRMSAPGFGAAAPAAGSPAPGGATPAGPASEGPMRKVQSLLSLATLHMPRISLAGTMPQFSSMGHSLTSLGNGVAGFGAQLAAAAAPAPPPPPPPPEVLRRTRKAFPMHADSEDFAGVLAHVRAAFPDAPLVAVGFSMGTNVLVKFLGEDLLGREQAAAQAQAQQHAAGGYGPAAGSAGAAVGSGATAAGSVAATPARFRAASGLPAVNVGGRNPLLAGVSISNGYDIIEGSRNLVSQRPLADGVITAALRKLLRRKLPEVRSICAAHGVLVDFDELLACHSLREFEEKLMLPIYGHASLDDYYRQNNCTEGLQRAGRPLLCLSSRDDPIIDPALLRHAETAAAANPNVLLAVTKKGGHLGWMQGWRGRTWMMEVTMQYVEAVVAIARQQEQQTQQKEQQQPEQPARGSAITASACGPDAAAQGGSGGVHGGPSCQDAPGSPLVAPPSPAKHVAGADVRISISGSLQ